MKKKKICGLIVCGLLALTSCDIISIVPKGSSNDSISYDSSDSSSNFTSEISSVDSDSQTTSEITSSGDITSIEESSSSIIDSDPYENVDVDEFYADYHVATSYEDAYYRSAHYLMSGIIEDQGDKPTLATDQPMDGSHYVRNTSDNYIYNSENEKIGYNIIDAQGQIVDTIYRGGGYVNLEEVAAYVYAFGEITSNHIASNDDDDILNSPWGKYCRGNFSEFECDTNKYPDEPDLPDNYGGNIGSDDKKYYEMDIGTTGTDTGGGYTVGDYNDGDRIIRGAARIVFTYKYSNNSYIDNPDERHVFYTYNHYSDYQEYLNYWGGWGQMFGTRYSKSDVYPETISNAL